MFGMNGKKIRAAQPLTALIVLALLLLSPALANAGKKKKNEYFG